MKSLDKFRATVPLVPPPRPAPDEPCVMTVNIGYRDGMEVCVIAEGTFEQCTRWQQSFGGVSRSDRHDRRRIVSVSHPYVGTRKSWDEFMQDMFE